MQLIVDEQINEINRNHGGRLGRNAIQSLTLEEAENWVERVFII